MEKLLMVMARLRSETGCPWDRDQTIRSLRPYLLEEAHEVLEAMEKNDYRELCEELGDLLMQIVFQAQIAKEAGEFSFDDVATGICEKMIRRHPHVFEDMKLDTAEDVVREWDNFKKKEGKTGIFEGIPQSIPALLMAEKYQKRGRKIGLDFTGIEEVKNKIQEELREISESSDMDEMEDEFGDLLFSVVNYGRLCGICSETALLRANRKFRRRVDLVDFMLEDNPQREEIINSPQLLDQLWEKAKKEEGGETGCSSFTK